MIRLPRFEIEEPATLEEAAALLSQCRGDAALLAGGTDLLPNMKRRQARPKIVVSLKQIPHLRGISSGFSIGAMTRLCEIEWDQTIRNTFPCLAEAVAVVATPVIRNQATIGGNLCIDTRCSYYTQSEEWRRAIGFCMKKDGTTCWVAPSSRRCLALSSTDTAPALIALDAEVTLVGPSGSRRIPLEGLYRNDGMDYLNKRPEEILASIQISPISGRRSTYLKLRRRGSIDFPLLGVAVSFRLDDGQVTEPRIVLGAAASAPKRARQSEGILTGKPLTDDRIEEAAQAASRIAKPVDNADLAVAWRKSMTRLFVAAALRRLRGDEQALLPLVVRRAIGQATLPAG